MLDMVWDPTTAFLVGVMAGGVLVLAMAMLSLWKDSSEW
jgi:hypothetical protein